jgi:hypothetical protein
MIVEGGSTYGAHGALKVPHAATLHAAQVLPALALLALAADLLERQRVEIVLLGAVGYATLIGSTAVQAYAGRSPWDLDLLTSVLALGGLGLLITSGVLALRGVAARLHGSTPQPAVPPTG